MAKVFRKQNHLNINGSLYSIEDPVVMGILNITPDSFFDGGKFFSPDNALARVTAMVEEGADIVDVGAWSSRPGSKLISEQEELNRLLPVLEEIRLTHPDVVLSVDTFRSGVARKVVNEFNVNIINDISAGNMDSNMFETIAELQVPYIMMHMKGTPETMQVEPFYENLFREIVKYFSERVDKLRILGVNDIILDPGFGFGKTLEHNFELLARLDEFKVFELPVLAGLSRKSMIYRTIESTQEHSLEGTVAANIIALQNGADILRVHDVKAAKECIRIYVNTHS
ncbi:dihydropteroate synthase [Saccharicrinis sp. FJH54]|uniref:dihydropteroate synthase n=1 Tax=Saccharicrinis sp. FJH54 TaxID=3344665 RepID=UPI0035D510BA